jgi:hypothetical protein
LGRRSVLAGKGCDKVKEYQLEIPLRWGDMDATPQAFQHQAPRAMASTDKLIQE